MLRAGYHLPGVQRNTGVARQYGGRSYPRFYTAKQMFESAFTGR